MRNSETLKLNYISICFNKKFNILKDNFYIRRIFNNQIVKKKIASEET